MEINLTSRHCHQCEKNVVDFTQLTKGEIIYYLLSNPTENTCGRIQRQQVDFYHEDVPALIEALSKKGGNTSFLILALVCLSLVACKEDNRTHRNAHKPSVEKKPTQTEMVLGEVCVEPTTTNAEPTVKQHVPVKSTPDMSEVVMGEIAPLPPKEETNPTPQDSSSSVLSFAEKMPEYVGGMAAMWAFMRRELNYPTTEKEAGIQGTVYVQFIVRQDGTLSNFSVLRGIKGGEGLNKEALRIVSKMPHWIPGANNGKNVSVYYRLPIKFQLD